MDRTEEMMELVTRMVTIIMEERSEMCREIEKLNLALEKLQDSISSLQQTPEPQVSGTELQV
ncbi:MAG: hypothetical protein KBS57_04965, partial [Alistipes sp.]|nr:hypothetical protein [Candidatus Minthomonas equi]